MTISQGNQQCHNRSTNLHILSPNKMNALTNRHCVNFYIFLLISLYVSTCFHFNHDLQLNVYGYRDIETIASILKQSEQNYQIFFSIFSRVISLISIIIRIALNQANISIDVTFRLVIFLQSSKFRCFYVGNYLRLTQ